MRRVSATRLSCGKSHQLFTAILTPPDALEVQRGVWPIQSAITLYIAYLATPDGSQDSSKHE